MLWFILALSAPMLWAVTTHADAFLARMQYRRTGLVITMTFSGVANLATAALCLMLGASFAGDLRGIAAAFAGGALAVMYLMPYYATLEYHEEVVAVTFFQMIPPLTIILGYLVLGEVLTPLQLLAAAVVFGGVVWLSFHHVRRGWVIDSSLVLHMGLSSLLFAVAVILFKYAALFLTPVSDMFWFGLGGALPIFIAVAATVRSRKDFAHLAHHHIRYFFGIGALSEGCDQLGGAAQRYASLLAPVGIVQVVGALMPLFVYLLSAGLRRFAPSLAFPAPRFSRVERLFHAAAILVIVIGASTIASAGGE